MLRSSRSTYARTSGVSCTTARRWKTFEETVRLVEKTGQRIIARKADVRDYESLKAVVDEGVADFGHLDIVAANAGIAPPPYRAHEFAEQLWQDVLDVNLTGAWHTCKAALPHLLANGKGSIVITASDAGLQGYANISAYCASKHGVIGMMRTLANEYGGSGFG